MPRLRIEEGSTSVVHVSVHCSPRLIFRECEFVVIFRATPIPSIDDGRNAFAGNEEQLRPPAHGSRPRPSPLFPPDRITTAMNSRDYE